MNHLFQINQFSKYAKTKDIASQKTRIRKAERNNHGSRRMFDGITNKVSQKVIDTPKNKLDNPTGAMTVNTRKTQRNEKCPCGSDKKFKYCHLN